MPSAREKQEVAADMMDRFGLPGFAYGVDGMVAVFNEVIYCIYNFKINK